MTIEEICEKYNIINYTINNDGSIDVDGNVVLSSNELTEIPLRFNKVTNCFLCSNNKLTSLKGSPKWVGGHFNCNGNSLTNLEFSPEYVGGDFCCYSNQLTTLKGCPKKVEGDFICSDNKLTDLSFGPEYVGDSFYCSSNYIKDIKELTFRIEGYLYCSGNPVGKIFTIVDRHFIYTFNFYKVIKNDTVNLKRLRYVMDLYDKPIFINYIKDNYNIVSRHASSCMGSTAR